MTYTAVLVGAGKVGAGYANDAVMAKYYPYATHAQVLASHAEIEWCGVVDRDPSLAEQVALKWRVPRFGTTFREVAPNGADLAVLAIPPGERLAALDNLVGVRALLVEKPLGGTESEGRTFLNACAARGIVVQVNLWRRADERMRELVSRRKELLGHIQAAFGVYGNGLHNNGTHIVDAVRMILGEVRSVWSAPMTLTLVNGPIEGDVHVSCVLMLETGLAVHLAPLDFKSYRENALDIWGTRGRVCVMHEGLGVVRFPVADNRAMDGEREISFDAPTWLEPSCGYAYARMYDNLVASLAGAEDLVSTGESALRTDRIVALIEESARKMGEILEV